MQFFKVEGLIADENWAEKCDDRRSLREKVRKIAMQSNAFNQKQKKRAFFYVTDASEDTATIGVICRESINFDKQIIAFLNAIKLSLKDIYVEEKEPPQEAFEQINSTLAEINSGFEQFSQASQRLSLETKALRETAANLGFSAKNSNGGNK